MGNGGRREMRKALDSRIRMVHEISAKRAEAVVEGFNLMKQRTVENGDDQDRKRCAAELRMMQGMYVRQPNGYLTRLVEKGL